MKNNFLILTVVIVIVGVIAFFGGMKFQESKSGGNRQFNAGQFNNGGRGGNTGGRFGGARPVMGEILSSDDKSITVKIQDGSSKIILISDKTAVNKASNATKADLTTGAQVAVFGNENSDGSVTAQNIQLNPQFSRMGRGPNQNSKSADAKEIVVEGSNYRYSPNKITVKKGEKTRIVFKNSDGTHDFRVDELNIVTAIIRGGEEDFVEFTPEKSGKFEFYCSVANHRQMGMTGTLIVE